MYDQKRWACGIAEQQMFGYNDISHVSICPGGYDYFEEMRGFSPDIWVPAKEAETLAAKLMENLK